jgi:hypothetical protein
LLRYINDVSIPYIRDECLIWPYSKGSNGYGLVKHNGKHALVHRLVCEEVNGPPPTLKHEAAHSCGNGHLGCVNPKHLRWDTPKGNAADRIIHGTHRRGERQWQAKLTVDKVLAIRSLEGKFTKKEIGNMFGVVRQTISDIILRKKWAHLA